MDFLMDFIQERWYVIAGALIALFIVVKVVKTVIKWVLIAALLAGLYFYGASYKDQLIELGSTVGAQAAAELKTQVVKVFGDEIKEAAYKQQADGSYTVTTKSVRLDGKPGESDIKVTFMNRSFTVKMDDVMKALVDQAKKNAGVQ
ncbi:hypothetical protein [Paenibacillus puerhi]|uniref:hypothetical protein n=1 Tax=Paenibacillus puerhi TaxID=2692622 RepID=UPI00135A50E8|nr:hypothetical protein [Paenibacillus puerhi]